MGLLGFFGVVVVGVAAEVMADEVGAQHRRQRADARERSDLGADVVGFLDDDKGKARLRVHGHKVRGRGKDLAAVAEKQGAEAVIYAISRADAAHVDNVSKVCEDKGLDLIMVPPLREMVGGQVTLGSLRHLNVTDLLGRRPIKTDLTSISDYVTGKVVLVTDAARP